MGEIKLNHNELEEHLEEYMTKGISLYVWGTTGIGKSQTVEKVSRKEASRLKRKFVMWHKLSSIEKQEVIKNPKAYYVMIDKRLSQMDPTDLRGLPNMNGNDTVEWRPPTWLKLLSHPDARGSLFLDEINLSPPSLQSSAYQIINDHALDELSITKDVSIVAAGNTKKDKANTFEIPKPLQNRFGHCVLKVPNVDDWIDWAIDHDIDDRIIAFLKFKPSLLFKFDPDSAEHAFPTPRSWGEFCSKLIKDKPDKTKEQRAKIKRFVSSSVGSGTAIEFVAFLKLRQNIKLQDVLNNPDKVQDIKSLDLKYSLISLLTEWYTKNFKTKDVETLLKIADNLEDEFAILLLKLSKKKHESSFLNNVTKVDIWKRIGKEYGKYLM